MHWETFSPEFGNVQSGQPFSEGKMSILGKAFWCTRFSSKTEIYVLPCRKQLLLKCSQLCYFKKFTSTWNHTLSFFSLRKLHSAGDNSHKTTEPKMKTYLLYKKTSLLPCNLGRFHRTCASFYKPRVILYIDFIQLELA